MLQISELRVSLTQITRQDHKIHNVDDKFTITYSWINIIRVLKTQSRSTSKSGKTVFQNFLPQNSIFRDMMLCHWVISSQHSFKTQGPLNDTEWCKNLKFRNFLSVKKFISNAYMHQWHGWTSSWPKCPRDMGWWQIPLLLVPPYFRSFNVFEKGSLHESINNTHKTTWKEITYKCGPKQFQSFDKFCKNMCSVTQKYGAYIHRHIHTYFNTGKHIKAKIEELFPTSNILKSQKRSRISDLNCGIFLFWVCHIDKYHIYTIWSQWL